jgi:hypothetical protein
MSKVDQVKEYVLKNYKEYKNEIIMVSEHESHYSIKKHRDGSPLVLSKSIV